MRWLLLLFSSCLWGAAGDITAVRIAGAATCTAGAACNGIIAEIDISQGGGATPGISGTYSLGFGTDNNPSAAKIIFSVTSSGYSTSAVLGTIVRSVWGTYQVRKPYPNNAANDEVVAAGTLTVRVFLSDMIYSSDTVTVSISAPAGVGFYSQGGVQAGTVTNLAVTNNSTQSYVTSICRWAGPVQYTAVTGNFRLEAVCFNRFAINSKPLAAVKFSITDGTNTVNYTANDIEKIDTDSTDYGDQYKVLVYTAIVDVSTLTQGLVLTANVKAYPWVGDASAIYDSSAGPSQPSALMSDLYLLNDKTSAYSGAFAIVDPTGGGLASNATTNIYTSRAAAEAAYNAPDHTKSYTTVGYALDAIKSWNGANKSHTDPGGGTILLVGSYTYSSTGRYVGSGVMNTWVTIDRLSTVAKVSAIWAGNSASFIRTLRLKFNDITISSAASAISDDATTNNALWIHNCDINLTLDGAIGGYTVAYATKNNVTALRNGFTNSGTTKSPWALVRGNIFPQGTTPAGTRLADLYTVLGNKNVRLKPRETGDTSGAPISSNSVAAYNASFYLNTGWTISQIGYNAAAPISNVAIVQNLVETYDGSGAEAQLIAAGDLSSEDQNNNYIFWHNTFVGARTNLSYNDGNLNGGSPKYRWNWSLRGNNFDDINIVADADTHGGFGPDGARLGGWSVKFGIGLRGNAYFNRTIVGAANTYSPDFAGILSHVGNNEDPVYTHNYSYSGTGTGNGDYHPTATSTFLNLIRSGDASLPYDLDGVARRNDGTGASGAYELPLASVSICGCTIPQPIIK